MVGRDLERPALPRRKVQAAAVRLLDHSAIRVGHAEYASQNVSFGLTTLRRRHVAVRGSTIRLDFAGKGGRAIGLSLDDARLARVLRGAMAVPGWGVFHWVDESNEHHPLEPADVNEYLRSVLGDVFSAKDYGHFEAVTASLAGEADRLMAPGRRASERLPLALLESLEGIPPP